MAAKKKKNFMEKFGVPEENKKNENEKQDMEITDNRVEDREVDTNKDTSVNTNDSTNDFTNNNASQSTSKNANQIISKNTNINASDNANKIINNYASENINQKGNNDSDHNINANNVSGNINSTDISKEIKTEDMIVFNKPQKTPMDKLIMEHIKISKTIEKENYNVMAGFMKRPPQSETYCNPTIQVRRDLYKAICDYIRDAGLAKTRVLNEIFHLGVEAFIKKYNK